MAIGRQFQSGFATFLSCSEREIKNRCGRNFSLHGAPLLRLADAGSGSCLGAADPFVQTDAAEARFTQRHERALLDPAAEVSEAGERGRATFLISFCANSRLRLAFKGGTLLSYDDALAQSVFG